MTEVVILGAGQAGVQTAFSLRDEGFQGRITLVSDEEAVPYQRPPLSKGLLLGTSRDADLPFRTADQYTDARITLMLGQAARHIDRRLKHVVLQSGEALSYDHLVLATGSRHRRLGVPGVQLEGVGYLRTLPEAHILRSQLDRAERVVIVGAGFVGLEVAAAARALGRDVTVVEVAARPMGRATSSVIAEALLRYHRIQGVGFRFGEGVQEFIGNAGRLREVKLTSGARLPADVALVGIGAVPAAQLAEAAGLQIDNGIVVDNQLLTSDPCISAVGDCANHPNPFDSTGHCRLESVQNATAHGRCAALRLVGKGSPYSAVPWFWSDQGKMKLQIAGLGGGCDHSCVRGRAEELSFSVFSFRHGTLIAVESLNRGIDHVVGRKLVGSRRQIDPALCADESIPLNRICQ